MKLPKYCKVVIHYNDHFAEVETLAKVDKFVDPVTLKSKHSEIRLRRDNGSFVSLLVLDVTFAQELRHRGHLLVFYGKEPETKEDFRKMFEKHIRNKNTAPQVPNMKPIQLYKKPDVFSHTGADQWSN